MWYVAGGGESFPWCFSYDGQEAVISYLSATQGIPPYSELSLIVSNFTLYFSIPVQMTVLRQVVLIRFSLIDSPKELQGADRIPSLAAEFIHNHESPFCQLLLQGSMMHLSIATGREHKSLFLCHGRQRLHKLEERLVVFPKINPGPEPDQVIGRERFGFRIRDGTSSASSASAITFATFSVFW